MKVIITMHLKNICLKNASVPRAQWVKIFVFWLIFNETFRKKFQWNINQNTKDFLSRKCFGKCCWQNGSHLFQPSMICEEYFCTMCGYHIYIYIFFSLFQCMCLYWTCSSTYGFLQNIAMRLPTVRRTCGIPKVPSESQTPYRDMAKIARSRFQWKKKSNDNESWMKL